MLINHKSHSYYVPSSQTAVTCKPTFGFPVQDVINLNIALDVKQDLYNVCVVVCDSCVYQWVFLWK